MQCLCMLNDEVGASFIVDGFSKRRLDLFGYIEIVEDWHTAVISLDDIHLVGSYESHIVFYLLIDIAIVDINAIVGRIK